MPIVVGPTAVGKTAVAVALAGLRPVSVISADSRQVYRRLDIGTAKPDAGLRVRVPHLGIDVIDPGTPYSAGRFAVDAARWLRAVAPERLPVVVGGTGFYIRALVEGLFCEPDMDPEARAAFRRWSAGRRDLVRWAGRLDPAFGGGGVQRAARTVEVALLSGYPLSWWHRRARTQGAVIPWYVRLSLPRPMLRERIELRVRAMLGAGWIDEVRRILDDGVPPDAAGLDGVGYREIVRCLAGELTEAELPEAIAASTRQYAKRQETWFRNQMPPGVLVLDATQSPETLARIINEMWDEGA